MTLTEWVDFRKKLIPEPFPDVSIHEVDAGTLRRFIALARLAGRYRETDGPLLPGQVNESLETIDAEYDKIAKEVKDEKQTAK